MKVQSFLVAVLWLAVATSSWGQLPSALQNLGSDAGLFTGKGKKGRLNLVKDTTRYLYGPHTTKLIREEALLQSNYEYHYVDTTITNLHRSSFVEAHNFEYQDLSNIHTPLHPIFYQKNKTIGFRLGYESVEPYFPENRKNDHINTPSPFINWHSLLGVRGRTSLGVEFSQNITPQWNFGVSYDRSEGNILIGDFRLNDRDLQVEAENVRFYQSFVSKNEKQRLLLDFHNFNYTYLDTGGIVSDTLFISIFASIEEGRQLIDSFFLLPLGQLKNKLDKVTNKSKVQYGRLFYEYKIFKTLQVYSRLEYFNQHFWFDNPELDKNPIEETQNFFIKKATSSSHYTRHRAIAATLGTKGTYNKLHYRFELENSVHKLKEQDFEVDLTYPSITQSLLRTYGNYEFKGIQLKGTAQWLLGQKDVLLEANGNYKDYQVDVHWSSYQPTWLQKNYYGRHFQWNSDFDNTKALLVSAKKTIRYKTLRITPTLHYHSISDWVYFDERSRPNQATLTISYLQPEVKIAAEFPKKVHHSVMLRYNSLADSTYMRMPRYFANYQVFFQSLLWNTRWVAQFGIDFHWHSAFYSDMYHPVTQQFYLQDFQKVRSILSDDREAVRMTFGNYLLANVFLNFNIGTLYGFFKLTNALQGLLGQGYFSTRDYMGIPRGVEIGFRWLMFR